MRGLQHMFLLRNKKEYLQIIVETSPYLGGGDGDGGGGGSAFYHLQVTLSGNVLR